MFENIEWKLVAEDQASATFNKVARAQEEVAKSSSSMTKRVNESSSSWSDIAKGVFAGGVALNAARKAFDFLKNTMMDSVAQAEEYQRVQGQLEAVLRSTAGAAGITQSELNDMADSMANFAQGGSEAINSLQGILLTFTGITKENFEATTMAALDMATSLNSGVLPTAEQLKGQAIQLGKALNSPKEGLTALTRVGVVFTEEQKKTIKTMQDAGDVAGAQRVILEELAKEYGGSASAAANTFQGRVVALTNSIDDAKKLIGQAFLPTLSMLTGDMVDATGKIKVNDETMALWQKRIFTVVESVKTIIRIIGGFGGVIVALGNIFVKSEQIILAWGVDVVKGLFNVGKSAREVFKALQQAVSGDFGGAISTLKNLVVGSFTTTIDYGGQLMDAFSNLGTSVQKGMQNAGDAIVDMARRSNEFDAFAENMRNTADQAVNTGEAVGGIGDGAGEAAEKVKEALEKLETDYQGARDKIQGALQQLEEDHADNVAGIKEKLLDLQAALSDTMDAYTKTMADLNKSEAGTVVEQEQKIADLKKQIADEQTQATQQQIKDADELAKKESQLNILYQKRNELTGNEKKSSTTALDNQIAELEKQINEAGAGGGSTTRLAELQAQLDAEQKAYDDYIESTKLSDEDLAEARRRASETQFQRDIEDIATRREEEQRAYNEKIALIQGEVAEQEAALAEEQAIYEGKKALYAEVDAAFQAFHDKYLQNLDDMQAYTSETVGVMTAELKRISDLFNEIQSLRTSAGLQGISLGSAVDAGASTEQTTNNNSSVTQQVTNNITIQVQGDTDVARQTVAEIQRQLELAKLGSS